MLTSIHLKKVSFRYPDRATPALDNVDLDIEPGTITLIVGASGSGKSTLCYTFNGVIPHVIQGELTGQVMVDGVDTRQRSVCELAQWVGLVFQDPEVMFANLFVGDEIAFGPANLGWPKADILARIGKVVEFVGLQGLEERPVWNLSGGQMQRLGLACVLAMRPGVVVLDEPTSNLDPASHLKVYALLQDLKAAGTAVVVVTHELDELLPQADQLVVMDHGRAAYAGPPRQALDRYGPQIRSLGIWLPEVVELGLDLRERLRQPELPLSLTVTEAASLLAGYASHPGEVGQPVPATLATAADAPVVLSAQNVTYAYPGRADAHPAVAGASFQIRQGELVALLGGNGAGKSTLAKLMVGLLKPAAGQLRVASLNVARATPQALSREIGFVFQNPEHQFVTDSVYDEIAYGLIANRVKEAELMRRVEDMLRLMDLEEFRRDHPFALPAGKKRRLGVATMLVGQPRILIVDEPTYGQDRRMTESLMETMLHLQRAGTTIMMITHDMRLVETYIPRSIVMAQGQILFDGPTPELFLQEDVLQQAALRVTSLRALVRQLGSAGRPLPDAAGGLSTLLDALGVPAGHSRSRAAFERQQEVSDG